MERVSRTLWSVIKIDRKSTRLNSSHLVISYAVFCLKKKKNKKCHHEPTVLPDTSLWRERCSMLRPSRIQVCVHTRGSAYIMFRFFFFFFFNDTATTEIYTLSLHDALPI